MTYNWSLWNNFVQAAEELNLELRSLDGGCVYVEVPEDIREKFYVMCWTPLNKLPSIQRKQAKGSFNTFEITNLIDDFRQNHNDFHLEFGAKAFLDGHMNWFPELGLGTNPTKDQIVNAIKIMLDKDNFEKYRLMAILKEDAE